MKDEYGQVMDLFLRDLAWYMYIIYSEALSMVDNMRHQGFEKPCSIFLSSE